MQRRGWVEETRLSVSFQSYVVCQVSVSSRSFKCGLRCSPSVSVLCVYTETQKYGILEVGSDLRVLCMKEKPLPSETKSRSAVSSLCHAYVCRGNISFCSTFAVIDVSGSFALLSSSTRQPSHMYITWLLRYSVCDGGNGKKMIYMVNIFNYFSCYDTWRCEGYQYFPLTITFCFSVSMFLCVLKEKSSSLGSISWGKEGTFNSIKSTTCNCFLFYFISHVCFRRRLLLTRKMLRETLCLGSFRGNFCWRVSDEQRYPDQYVVLLYGDHLFPCV